MNMFFNRKGRRRLCRHSSHNVACHQRICCAAHCRRTRSCCTASADRRRQICPPLSRRPALPALPRHWAGDRWAVGVWPRYGLRSLVPLLLRLSVLLRLSLSLRSLLRWPLLLRPVPIRLWLSPARLPRPCVRWPARRLRLAVFARRLRLAGPAASSRWWLRRRAASRGRPGGSGRASPLSAGTAQSSVFRRQPRRSRRFARERRGDRARPGEYKRPPCGR